MKKSFDHAVIFLVLIAVIIIGTGVFVWTQVRSDRISDLVARGDQIGVLWVVEHEGAPLWTQVLLYNPVSARGALFDIPGNVGSILGALNRVDRIDAVFREGNVDLFRETVARLLGAEIPFFITVSLDDLASLVDLIEGVRVFVDVAGVDPTESIRLPSGNVVLDGSNLDVFFLEYAALASTEERVGIVQAFTQNLIDRLGERSGYLNHSRVRPFVARWVDSNLDNRSLHRLFIEFDRLESGRLVYRQVQGNLRTVEAESVRQELLFPHFEGQWLRQTVRQVQESLASEVESFEDNALISLEILNGTGVTGLARRTQDLMQGFGFNVVHVGNAETNEVEHTLVIDRTGNPAFAQRVAGIIQADRVVTDRAAESAAAVTLVLGRDFDGTNVRR